MATTAFLQFVFLSGKYRIELLSKETVHDALNVVKNSLCQDEPICIALGINKNPRASEELLMLGADAALDGVSIVALAAESREVVAVAFNKIQVQTSNASEKAFFEIFAQERCKDTAARAVLHLMADLDDRCNLFEKYGVDCSLEIMYLATLREHRHQGLAKVLSEASIEIAKAVKDGKIRPLTVEELGPKYSMLQSRKPNKTYPKICQAIWTSIGSQKIGKAMNFSVHLKVPLSEFVFDGKTYSERLGDDSAFCEVAAIGLYQNY